MKCWPFSLLFFPPFSFFLEKGSKQCTTWNDLLNGCSYSKLNMNKSHTFLNCFQLHLSRRQEKEMILQGQKKNPPSSQTPLSHQAWCASAWNSHPQTCHHRCFCHQFRYPGWSHHPGTWTPEWHGGKQSPCNQSLSHQCRVHGSSLQHKNAVMVKDDPTAGK